MLATCLTNYHVSLAKGALAESLTTLHISTVEELLNAYQQIVEPITLINSDTVFTSRIDFAAPVEALQIIGSLYKSLKTPSECLEAKKTFQKRDCHSAGIMKILSGIFEWRLKEDERPGSQSVRTWVYSNYKPENPTSSKLGNSIPKSFKTQTEVVIDLEIVYGISSTLTILGLPASTLGKCVTWLQY